ncbi:hypothetical protein DFH28DRAFT_981387 [Melampsora americana]|nr:hypothetical protein DFH28DRAFT_981387 [Melampsora americana]
MNESSDYSALDLSRLVRLYAALSPSHPRIMPSPPFPTENYLVRTCHQAELFAALSPLDDVPDPAVSSYTKACRWKYAFWKRIIQVIENTSTEGISPESEEEGLDEQILLHYISLQRSDQPATVDILRYFYGPLNNRSEWKCAMLMEDKASISKGTTGLRSWGARLVEKRRPHYSPPVELLIRLMW